MNNKRVQRLIEQVTLNNARLTVERHTGTSPRNRIPILESITERPKRHFDELTNITGYNRTYAMPLSLMKTIKLKTLMSMKPDNQKGRVIYDHETFDRFSKIWAFF
jgi:hypothetical protein